LTTPRGGKKTFPEEKNCKKKGKNEKEGGEWKINKEIGYREGWGNLINFI
jgi:hypothetical protein